MFMFNTTYYTAEVLATDVVLTTENDERFYTATLCPLAKVGKWFQLAEAAAINYITNRMNIDDEVAAKIYHLFFTDELMLEVAERFEARYNDLEG